MACGAGSGARHGKAMRPPSRPMVFAMRHPSLRRPCPLVSCARETALDSLVVGRNRPDDRHLPPESDRWTDTQRAEVSDSQGGDDPPAIGYHYAPDRRHDRPIEHLADSPACRTSMAKKATTSWPTVTPPCLPVAGRMPGANSGVSGTFRLFSVRSVPAAARNARWRPGRLRMRKRDAGRILRPASAS